MNAYCIYLSIYFFKNTIDTKYYIQEIKNIDMFIHLFVCLFLILHKKRTEKLQRKMTTLLNGTGTHTIAQKYNQQISLLLFVIIIIIYSVTVGYSAKKSTKQMHSNVQFSLLLFTFQRLPGRLTSRLSTDPRRDNLCVLLRLPQAVLRSLVSVDFPLDSRAAQNGLRSGGSGFLLS